MKQQWIVVIETRFRPRGLDPRLKLKRRFMQNMLDEMGLPIYGHRLYNGVWAGAKSIKEKK